MKFEIKSWTDAGLLFSCETEPLKLAIEVAEKDLAALGLVAKPQAKEAS